MMIGHINGGKGWLFYDPGSKVLLKSAITVFPYEDRFATRVEEPMKTATTSESLNKLLDPVKDKGKISFIVNALKLGSFEGETAVSEEDKCVEEISNTVNISAPHKLPSTYQEAMKDRYAEQWRDAMKSELAAMDDMSVWRVVDPPTGVKTLGLRWVYTYKQLDALGMPIKFKARLVAQGFTQREGIDYQETFAPTATFASLRMLLALASRMRWPVHSFDVTSAYLHSDLDGKLYFKLPPGFMDEARAANKVLEALKALYRTKQGARCWWKHFEAILVKLGFVSSQYDQSLYVCRRGEEVCVIWVHVDDGAVMGSSVKLLDEISDALVKSLKIRWSKSLDHIIGIDVESCEDGSFELSQPGLTQKILRDYLTTEGTAKVPMHPSHTLTTAEDGETLIDSSYYLAIVGSLNYLSVATRPDLTYATNFLARFASKPTQRHLDAAQHVLRYLKTQGCLKLHLKAIDSDVKTGLHTYVDANWGGEYSRSVHGFTTFLLGCPIAWTSKRQMCVATSTCHAEYMALGTAAREAVWLRNLVMDVMGAMGPVGMFCDNTAAIHVSKDNSSNKRTRHTNREFYYVNEQLFKGTVTLHWIDSKRQKADILTKALGPTLFQTGRESLRVIG